MKKVIYFVGAGLVISVVAPTMVYLLNGRKKKKGEVVCDYNVPGVDKRPIGEDTLTEVTVAVAQNEPTYEEVKSSVVGNMYSRHEGAATIMSDSVETIRENVRISEDVNDKITAVSDELDKMLSED